VDSYLGSIFAALDARPILKEKVAIILTADHGGGGGEYPVYHTDANLVENYTIPFFLIAPGVEGGSDIYALLADRFNPGSSRPLYTALAQPVRNVDVANLSMSLLGLPNVPGALLPPVFSAQLTIELVAGSLKVRWTDHNAAWELQVSSDLDAANWETIGFESILKDGGKFTYIVGHSTPGRFFRLRRR
jgi:hypothetical protein